MLERAAIEKFHGDERLAVFFSDVVNCADIWVVESRGSLGLTAEAGQILRVFGDIVRQEFQGHEAAEPRVLGFIHYSHATTAKLLDDAIVRDALSDHWSRILRLR